jgi:hypothetical protein
MKAPESTHGMALKKVHLVLQGKGGVGKSYIASLLAQYHQHHQRTAVCLDTDPANATFMGYKAYEARAIELLVGSSIQERGFDTMMEAILTQDAHFVVDNGAASFIPLSNYLLENDAIRVMAAANKQVVIHTVITGNQAMLDTLRGLDGLCNQLPQEADIVVWLNEFFGPVEMDGKSFEELAVYAKHRKRITSLVRIPQQTSSTFGRDVALMLEKKLTFADVNQSPEFGVMARQRLTFVKRAIFDQLAIAV